VALLTRPLAPSLGQNQETCSVMMLRGQRLKPPLEDLRPSVDLRRRSISTHAGGWLARQCPLGATSVAACLGYTLCESEGI
jgi:hypothetical protein